ncbi:MAG TPA: DUF4012 domain-containing protein [Jatrophihabitans sp.]|jgi:hypothetical protein
MSDEPVVEDSATSEPERSTPFDAGSTALDGAGWHHETHGGRVRVRRRRKRRRARRRILIGVGVLVLVLLAAVLWLLYSGFRARTQLEAVRAGVHSLRADIAAGDLAGARADAHELQQHADQAYDLTTGPVWAGAAALPYFGDPLDTAREITSGVHSIADQALPALVRAADTLNADSLRKPDGSIDVAAIRAVSPGLDAATGVLTRATSAIDASSGRTWLGSVNSARSDLLDQLEGLRTSVAAASAAADVAPRMLGADGPRTYMVTFENDAELRGTAGLPGAFAIMRADQGKISFLRFEADNELSATASGVRLGADFDRLWRADPTGAYVNSNQSPHFPYAARIWTAMWQHKSGQRLDGAIALDPTTLSYLLEVAGPATMPDGTKITASSVVAQTQSQVYLRFAKNNDARKRYLLNVARAVSRTLIHSDADFTALLQAAGKAASESRLLVWTSDGVAERGMARYPISGVVPQASIPYAGLTLVNGGGDKLSYYLHASFDYRRSGCGAVREVTATVTLRNDAPRHGLPRYVTDVNAGAALGLQQINVVYYASAGGLMRQVTHNGTPIAVNSGTERGHPVTVFRADLPIGTTQTYVLHLSEPAGTGAPQVRVQPMVRPMSVKVVDQVCGT